MAAITVAICFANERHEVARTVASIRDTAGGTVDILLMDDASDPDFDYAAVADRFHCRLHRNRERQGPGRCRTLATDMADTEIVLLLDGHTRFESSNWRERVEAAIDSDPEGLFCVESLPLNPEAEWTGQRIGWGAWVNLEPKADGTLLLPVWNTRALAGGLSVPVACVLGGAYAFRRQYFQRLGGHLGLLQYGGEEPSMCIKSWLAGGSCRLIIGVRIGHIYRQQIGMPYRPASASFRIYNRMALLATVFPESWFERYTEPLRQISGYAEATEIFRQQEAYLMNLRRHYHDEVFVRPFEAFLELNQAFKAGQPLREPPRT
jgi:glycosyltransferase involved in cell wall biosynthesis